MLFSTVKWGATILAVLSLLAGQASAESLASYGAGARLVDDLHSAFGVHPARAVHAKGILLEGSFKAAKQARTLSKATLFDGKSRRVTGRFSDFTGLPDIADASGDASPHGFGFKVHMQTERDYDVVAHSFNGFPVATSEEFGAFMRAVGESRAATSRPTPVEQFLGSHPIAKSFLASQKPPPVSFATISYFGVNAFKFTNRGGDTVFVRYRLVPVSGEHFLNESASKAASPDYLMAEVVRRVEGQPVQFLWYAQIASDGDVIDDPSVAWPETRRLVKLGTVTLKRAIVDPDVIDEDLIFLPGRVPEGIEIADPMLAVRDDSYSVSFDGRGGPPPTPLAR